MRYILGGIFLIFSAVVGMVPAPAEAKFNPENKIEVYGRVLATHHIVVDQNGIVKEVISNTPTDKPERIVVYSQQLSAEKQIPITENIKNQYQGILKASNPKIGTLYEAKANIKILSESLNETNHINSLIS